MGGGCDGRNLTRPPKGVGHTLPQPDMAPCVSVPLGGSTFLLWPGDPSCWLSLLPVFLQVVSLLTVPLP